MGCKLEMPNGDILQEVNVYVTTMFSGLKFSIPQILIWGMGMADVVHQRLLSILVNQIV